MSTGQIVVTHDALDALDAAALLVGPDGSILDANRAALDCHGHSLGEMRTLSIHDLRAPGDQSDIGREMRKAAEHGVVSEAVHQSGDGSLFPVEVRAIPVVVGGEPALLSIAEYCVRPYRVARHHRTQRLHFRAAARHVRHPGALSCDVEVRGRDVSDYLCAVTVSDAA